MRKLLWVMLAMVAILWSVSMECSAKEINENAGTRGAQLLKISANGEHDP